MAKKQTELVESVPQHILESPHLSGVQKKAFAKVKRAQKAEESTSSTKKPTAKKSATTADSGYGMGAGKDEKP